MQDLTTGLSLSEAIKNDYNINIIHKIANRRKKFQRQIAYHYTETGSYNQKAEREVTHMEQMEQTYRLNYLSLNDQKIKTIKKQVNKWTTAREHWENLTNRDWIYPRAELNEIQKSAIRVMQEYQLKANIGRIKYRVILELKEAIYKRKHIIMQTLTVAPEHYNKVFEKSSKKFREYILKCNKIDINHQYFAVTELGGDTGRPHIHLIQIFEQIPENWKNDPNKGKINPTYRIINQARHLWPYGYSSPQPVRINAADIWTSYNFRWPVKYNEIQKQYIPLPTCNSGNLAGYLVKYLAKQLPKKDVQTWKIRLSHQLGMKILNQLCQTVNQKILSKLISIAIQRTIIIHNQIIPTKIFRKAISKEIILRLKKNNNTTQLTTLEAQPSTMRRLQTMYQTTQMYNYVNTINSKIRKLKKVATSDLIYVQEQLDKIVIQHTGTLNPISSTIELKSPSTDRL